MDDEEWDWADVLLTAIADSGMENPMTIQYEDGLRTELTTRLARRGANVVRQCIHYNGPPDQDSWVDITTVAWDDGALRIQYENVVGEDIPNHFISANHHKHVDLEFYNDDQTMFLRTELKVCSVLPKKNNWATNRERWSQDIDYLTQEGDNFLAECVPKYNPRARAFAFLMDSASYRYIQREHRIRYERPRRRGRAPPHCAEDDAKLFPPWQDVLNANGQQVRWECLGPYAGLGCKVKLVRPTGLSFQPVYNLDEWDEDNNLQEIPNNFLVAGVIGSLEG